jgi:phospholipid/cholesterol/gamma-HCH transport system substrate-binding protein
MQKSAPRRGQILLALGFALSCFGLILFLWVAFGGPVPLSPEGYRFEIPLSQAGQLATESDVRISGVTVGKVKDIQLGSDGLAHATVELDSRYAPIPSNTKAILRQKTLLGETYVELTPGSERQPSLPEGGSLPVANVSPSVQLDEIFRTFNQPTRQAFQVWMQQQALAFRGRGADFSAAIGELPPFEASANRVLRILDTQRLAVRQLVKNGGETFQALSERKGQLSSLIRNSNTVFQTTARRNADLANTFRILPTFLRESRLTLSRLQRFSTTTDPLVKELRPAAQQLAPTVLATGRLAPNLESLFAGLLRATPLAKSGLPALRSVLGNDLPPLLTRLDPFLAQLDPLLTGLRDYKHEITAFLGNVAASLNAYNNPLEANGSHVHYLRSTAPLEPNVLAAYPRRLKTDRTNPYLAPLGYDELKSGLDSFETTQCSSGPNATLNPATPSDPNFQARAGGTAASAADLFARIQKYVFENLPDSNSLPAPPCRQQAKFRSIGVSPEMTRYLHVRREP